MKTHFLLSILLLFTVALPARGPAQSSSFYNVVPHDYELFEGNDYDHPWGINWRYQQVYVANQFPLFGGGGWIWDITFRVDATYGYTFGSTISNVQVNLSTTSLGPDQLSPIFANNVGPDDQIVRATTALEIYGIRDPGPGPTSFFTTIGFARPFFYDPERGNLLVDIRVAGGWSGQDPSPLDSVLLANDSVSSVYGFLGSANGTLSTEGLITRFSVKRIPEPTCLTLCGLGLAALIATCKLRRRR